MKHANAMGAGPNGGVVMFCGDDPTRQVVDADLRQPAHVRGRLRARALPRRPAGRARPRRPRVPDVALRRNVGRAEDRHVRRRRHRDRRPRPGSAHAERSAATVVIDGVPWRHQPLAAVGPHTVPNQEALVVEHRLRAARAYVRHNGLDRVVGRRRPVPASASCAPARPTSTSCRPSPTSGCRIDDLADVGVRVLKLAMTYPLVEETVVEFAASVDELVVIEEKRPFVETQLRSILHEARSPVPVLGKRDRTGEVLAPSVGELDPSTVAADPHPRAADAGAAPPSRGDQRPRLPLVQLPPRPPGVLQRVPAQPLDRLPRGRARSVAASAATGSCTSRRATRACRASPPTPMGAEGVPWIGLAPVRRRTAPHPEPRRRHAQPLRARSPSAPASPPGVNVTFKILYNTAVAMTGGQDVTGLMDVPSMTRALEAGGRRARSWCAPRTPKRYGRQAPWAAGRARSSDGTGSPRCRRSCERVPGRDRDHLRPAVRRGGPPAAQAGPAAGAAARGSSSTKRCARGAATAAPRATASRCCPLETEFGEKRQIHDLSCNRDYTCLDGDCPSFVTDHAQAPADAPTPVTADAVRPRRPSLPAGALPDSRLRRRSTGQYGIYFTGIGGTGVVTANRIVAVRGRGRRATSSAGMDQTGLSQKAGAVVSHLHLARDRERPRLGHGERGRRRPVPVRRHPAGGRRQPPRPRSTPAARSRWSTATSRRPRPCCRATSRRPTSPVLEAGDHGPGRRGPRGRSSTRSASPRTSSATTCSPTWCCSVPPSRRVGCRCRSTTSTRAIGGTGRAADDNRDAFEWGRWAVHDPAAVRAASTPSSATHDGGRAATHLRPVSRRRGRSASALVAPATTARRAARARSSGAPRR